MAANTEPLLVGEEDARRLLGGLSRNTLYRLRLDQGLPFVRIRGRVLYSVSALARWIEEHTGAAA